MPYLVIGTLVNTLLYCIVLLARAQCLNRDGGSKLNVTEPGRSFSVDLAIADAIILRDKSD